MLLMSSQYPSAIHPVVHPAVVDWPPVEVVMPPVVVGDEVVAVEVAVVVGVVLGVVLGFVLEVVLGVVLEIVVAAEVAVGIAVGVAEGVAVGVVLEVAIVVVVMFSRFEDVRLSERIELSILV